MSAKSNVIVPRGFTAADANYSLTRSPEKFQHLTNREVRELRVAGLIEPLGDSGKVWQWRETLPDRPSKVTEGGRVSLEIPFALRSFMATEMSARPSWAMEW